eukprot:gene9175-1650_t
MILGAYSHLVLDHGQGRRRCGAVLPDQDLLSAFLSVWGSCPGALHGLHLPACWPDKTKVHSLARLFPAARAVSVRGLRGGYSDTVVETLRKACPGAQRWDIRGCRLLSDPAVAAVLRSHGHVLTEVTMSSCLRYNQPVPATPTKVALSLPPQLDAASLESLLSRCPALLHLQLAQWVQPQSSPSIRVVGRCCPSLTHLDLPPAPAADSDDLSALAQGCKSLTHLSLTHTVLTLATGVAQLAAHCPSITYLDLSSSGMDGAGQALCDLAASCPGLHTVVLASCTGLSAEGLTSALHGFSSALSLKHIDLQGLPVQEEALLSFARAASHPAQSQGSPAFPSLLHLALTHPQGSPGRGGWGPQGLREVLAHLPLKSLALDRWMATDDYRASAFVGLATQIERLAIDLDWDDNEDVDADTQVDDTLALLQQGCPALTDLEVQNGCFTDAAVLPFSSCPLRRLCLRGCPNIRDSAIIAVARFCPRLAELCLEEMHGVTSAAICAVGAHCPLLE